MGGLSSKESPYAAMLPETMKTRTVTNMLIATALIALLAAIPANGEVQRPAQSVAANALPLTYMPPPANPASVCVVDTGVDINPDTKDSVVARLAAAKGITEVGDHSSDKHGTRVASVIAAPRNGWGMVGAWPAGKIVSVRTVGLDYIPHGISQCMKYKDHYNIKVIELAAGFPMAPVDVDQYWTKNIIPQAHLREMSIVAAAGNDGGELDFPANHPGVFAVSGTNQQGHFCRHSNGLGSASGPNLALSTLGCGLHLAFPDGRDGLGGETSEASAFTAAVLAALRSYRPDLTREAAEQLLISTASHVPAGRALNVEATFRAAGLTELWKQATNLVPPETQGENPQLVQLPYHSTERLEKLQKKITRRQRTAQHKRKLRIRIQRKGSLVIVRALNRPKGTILVITIRARNKKTRVIHRRASVVKMRLAKGEKLTAKFKREHRKHPRRIRL